MVKHEQRKSAGVLHLLGSFAVVDETGRPIGDVPAGRASLALQRIAAAGGGAVDLSTIVDALWPTDAPATAERTVASLVSRLRSSLGSDVVLGNVSLGYRLGSTSGWTTDIMQVERLVNEANTRTRSAPALAASASRRGLEMLERGRPLAGMALGDDGWVDDLSRHIDGLGRRLRRSLWAADIELGRWLELIDQAELALEIEPHDEEAARALMTAHWNNGDRGSALRSHDALRASLLDQLGVEPSNETEELYSAILRDDHTVEALQIDGVAIPTAIRLAGRDDELRKLVAAWGAAASGSVVSVVVRGPIGSGRTRLTEALAGAAERTGGIVLQADSAEGERSLFLHPILTMLTRVLLSTPPEDVPALLGPWLGTAAELIPELREVIEIAPYQRASADLEHRRALQTVAHVVQQLAERRPLLMIFDDLQHAGSSTVDALHWLQHELENVPLLILATIHADHRDDGLAALEARSRVIDLGPISRESVVALAQSEGLSDDAEFVWDLTEGHLLFVVEVLHALKRGVSRASLPDSLRSVVLDSARQAGPAVEKLLQVASFIGMSFDLRTLTHVVDRPEAELLEPLESAVAASLLQAREGDFVFSNRVIRDVLYEATIGPVRQNRHRRLVEVFADRPESRAWHEGRAGALDAAAASWLEAARMAQRAFSNADADRLFTEAISAAKTAGAVDVEGAALIGRGIVREELGRYDEATQDHLEAERLGLSTGDTRLQVQAVERQGWTAYYERDVSIAIARAEQATSMPGVHPSAWVLLGRIRHWGGEFDNASAAYKRALAELGAEDFNVRASALSCLGALLAHSDRYSEAIETLDESVALCHEIGAFRPLLRSLFFQGLARANAGDLSGALTALETKKTLLHRNDVPFYRARTNTCLAWVWRELGDLDRAKALSEQALDESREVDEGELQIEQELHALCSLAECRMMEGNPDGAVELLEDARLLLAGWLPFHWRAEMRVDELASRVGAESAERLLVNARDRGSAKYQALALHLLGQRDEAGAIAATTGSVLLLAEVAPNEQAIAARDHLVARLPRQLREGFTSSGRLARSSFSR